ncbi:MAG TPA: alpha-amylase family glycosyl hydrolase, partial [Candidatus Nanopelagicales bacterium]|nr:alpha-amylase family glycosyl hydrolase [Candidatus Nanopelagicales bacterium]
MKRIFYFAAATSITTLLSIAGCDGDEPVNPSTTTTTTTTGDGGSGGTGGGDVTDSYYIRIHYRLQADGNVGAWGAHFWGAGSTSPEWGSPQLFSMTDDFGAYTDVEVTSITDAEDAWLGLIPVQCTEGNCIKDVETGVRWIDLHENAENPGIRECWITQGQAVLREPPTDGAIAYEISNPRDFIDLGNGDVRLMFRVAPGSTGSVEYGSAPGTVDGTVTWSETDNINKNGLILQGLPTGAPTYYRIRTTLVTESGDLTDDSGELSLTPIAVEPVTTTADWATWGSTGIMYQLIVRTFADGGTPRDVADPETESGIDTDVKDGVGDLVGMTAQLPYLADLGVDAIWMTPVFAAKSYHGYDTTDFYAIDPAVGTIQDFRTMADMAESLGIKIIVDLVQNHVATVNPWFEAAIDPNHPDYATYHDWFLWSDQYSNMFTDPHPWDGSAVIWACKNYQCYHQIFGAQMPELNFRNPAVRAEMKKISE